MKIPSKCHNHEVQPSQGTKRRDEEQNKDKTNATYEITDAQTNKICNREIALERSVEKLPWGLNKVHVYITTQTNLYNFDPIKPHCYIVKLGFTGVYIFCFISATKHILWVLVRTASARRFQRVPIIYALNRNMKNIRAFVSENFQYFEVKFSIYLNRRVFVMRYMYTCAKTHAKF